MTVDKRVRTLFWQSSKMCCVTLFVLSWRCGLNSSSDGAVRVSCFSAAAYTVLHARVWLGKKLAFAIWWKYSCTFHCTFSKTRYWRRAYKLIIITETNIGSCHLLKQSGENWKRNSNIHSKRVGSFFSDYTHRMAFLAGWPSTADRKLHGICTRLWSAEVQRPYHFARVWQPFWP